jgi:hypothetical protein
MDNQVIRDPAVKDMNIYRVIFNDRICSPSWHQVGPALAYLDLLTRELRAPEYAP